MVNFSELALSGVDDETMALLRMAMRCKHHALGHVVCAACVNIGKMKVAAAEGSVQKQLRQPSRKRTGGRPHW